MRNEIELDTFSGPHSAKRALFSRIDRGNVVPRASSITKCA
jgi:hypothetical protein